MFADNEAERQRRLLNEENEILKKRLRAVGVIVTMTGTATVTVIVVVMMVLKTRLRYLT